MILEPIGQSIWLAEGKIVDFYGFPYPTRSIIIQMQNRDLWVWSPIALTPDLQQAIDSVGRVAHLVSPNKIHHLYLQDWQKTYPNALLWGPESTVRKRRDLHFEAPLVDGPPPEWQDEIDQTWFRGSPLLDEIVFFHRVSSTVIIADLSENFSDEFLASNWPGWKQKIARMCKITVGYGYAPLELRLTWFGRGRARTALTRMMAWNPERVIMAHGEWQAENGQEYLARAFSWL